MQPPSNHPALAQLLPSLHGTPGFTESEFLAAQAAPPVLSVRLNMAKPSGAFAGLPVVPWCAEGRYLQERPVFTLDPLLHAGAYYVQEASSMFLDYLLRAVMPARRGLRVLDLCAAPGGKSTLIANLLHAEDLLLSNEVIRTRAPVLEENLTRWGLHNTWVSANDPKDFARLPGYFDVMVVDAPCSGSGLWRKDAAAMDEWSAEAVAMCAARQKRILTDAWATLKEGGILIYATCSFSPQENEDILDWLGDTLQVESMPMPAPPEAWGIAVSPSPGHGFAGYRLVPGRVKGEGFFIAALRKCGAEESFFYPRYKMLRDKNATAAAAELLQGLPFVAVPDARRRYHAIHPGHEPDLSLLTDLLYLRKTGIELGEGKQKDWLPAHDVALAIHRNRSVPTFPLSREDALRFLKKEDVQAAPPGKGWMVTTYEGLGIGWLKAMTGRSNNYLPKAWRIRMEIGGGGK